MGWIQSGVDALKLFVAPPLEPYPMLQSLLADGVIGGVGAFLAFLPQILILFLFLGVLEDSGYMSRAAFIMDRLFSWCGLNGKSFVPMLSGFACAIPSLLSTRTIEDPKARLATAFVVPFMSCSARFPIYALMCGAFIGPLYGPGWESVVMVGMHCVGLLFAVPCILLGASWRWRDGALEVWDCQRLLGAWGRLWGLSVAGVTLGWVIIYRDAAYLESVSLAAHEHEHVRQFLVWGPLLAVLYPLASLLCLAALRTPPHYYRDNPFEIAAREASSLALLREG
jgi:hypothetical protein